MGLFSKAAPATVPPVPGGPEPDTLEFWQEETQKWAAIKGDKTATKQERENARHRYNYAADMVATYAEPGWNNQIKFSSPQPQHYRSLLKRMQNIDLEQEWLDAQLQVFNVNLIKSNAGEIMKLEGWTREQYESLSEHIAELEDKIKKLENEKKREKRQQAKVAPITDPENYAGPIALPNFSAKEVRPNIYTHGTNIECSGDEATEADYAKILNWALFNFNFDSSFVFGQYGVINNREKGETFTKTKLVMLQERLCQIVRTRKKGEAPKEEPKPEGEKPVGLFSKTATTADGQGVTDASTGEVKQHPEKIDTKQLASEVSEVAAQQSTAEKLQQQAAEAEKLNIMQEARLRLGINHSKGPLTVKDVGHADDIMRERAMAFLELQYIHERYKDTRDELEQRIKDIDMVYTEPLKHFYEQNKPSDGKKSWNLLYGELKKRNVALSVSLDPDDVGEKKLQEHLAKLHDSEDPLAEKFGVRKQTTFTRNLDSIAAWVKEQIATNKKAPVFPGIRVKPGEEDRFSVGPAFDTAWDKIKKGIFKIGE